MSIEVRGLDQANRTMEIALRTFGPKTERALFEAATLMTSYMKQRFLTNGPIHVRTGRLRGSWSPVPFTSEDSMGVVVGTAVKYARVHNYGFSGPVWVKEHLRNRARTGRARRGPRSPKGRLRQRAEARRAREHKARRESDTRRAHGLSLRGLQARSRTARRARGLQGGIAQTREYGMHLEAQRTGRVVVRGHGRFMKVRGHLYVERTIRDTTEPVEKLLAKRLAFETGGA